MSQPSKSSPSAHSLSVAELARSVLLIQQAGGEALEVHKMIHDVIERGLEIARKEGELTPSAAGMVRSLYVLSKLPNAVAGHVTKTLGLDLERLHKTTQPGALSVFLYASHPNQSEIQERLLEAAWEQERTLLDVWCCVWCKQGNATNVDYCQCGRPRGGASPC